MHTVYKCVAKKNFYKCFLFSFISIKMSYWIRLQSGTISCPIRVRRWVPAQLRMSIAHLIVYWHDSIFAKNFHTFLIRTNKIFYNKIRKVSLDLPLRLLHVVFLIFNHRWDLLPKCHIVDIHLIFGTFSNMTDRTGKCCGNSWMARQKFSLLCKSTLKHCPNHFWCLSNKCSGCHTRNLRQRMIFFFVCVLLGIFWFYLDIY